MIFDSLLIWLFVYANSHHAELHRVQIIFFEKLKIIFEEALK